MAVCADAAAGLRAAAAGATAVQLRNRELPVASLEEEAVRLVAGCPVPVIVSSSVGVALASGAAGVNLPEHDLPAGRVRGLLAGRLLGCSVHSLAAAREAEAAGADYLIFGPVFATASHPGRAAAGLQALSEVAAGVGIPVLALGGVAAARARQCRAAGAAGFAAIVRFR